MQFGIEERLRLGNANWRERILRDIYEVPWFVQHREKSTRMIYSNLARYEQLKQLREATVLLELALWKMSIGSSQSDSKGNEQDCRIRSGAEVVVPNVLSFLQGELKQHT